VMLLVLSLPQLCASSATLELFLDTINVHLGVQRCCDCSSAAVTRVVSACWEVLVVAIETPGTGCGV